MILENYGLALVLSVLAGLANVLGGVVVAMRRRPVHGLTLLYCTAAAAGFMLGVSFLDRMPDTFEDATNRPMMAVWLFAGFILVHLMEQWAGHGHHDHAHDSHASHEEESSKAPLISMSASLAAQWGLLLHTCFDGVAIGAGFSVSRSAGLLLFLAVIFHKVPEGFSLASMVLASGQGRRRALLWVLCIATSTVTGTLLVLMIAGIKDNVPHVLMALTAGSFLYVSTTLLHATQKHRNPRAAFCVLAGLILFSASAEALRMLGIK